MIIHQTPNLLVNGKQVIIRADRALFTRLLPIQEKHGGTIKGLLKYSPEPIACPLQHQADIHGSL